MKAFFVAAVAVLVAVVMVSAEIVTLTSANFDSIVKDETKDVFVKFYAPWCGHCVRMQPAWEALSEANTGAVIAEIDVTLNEDVAEKNQVEGFPTIKLFTKADKSGKEYNGGRDVASLTAFVKANI